MKKINKLTKEIPNEIKVLFGKFYLFSFIYIIFFGILYPVFLCDRISTLGSILLFILLFIVYLYMVDDIKSNKGTYSSNMYVYLIIIVFFLMTISLGRFLVTLEF